MFITGILAGNRVYAIFTNLWVIEADSQMPLPIMVNLDMLFFKFICFPMTDEMDAEVRVWTQGVEGERWDYFPRSVLP